MIPGISAVAGDNTSLLGSAVEDSRSMLSQANLYSRPIEAGGDL